MIKWSLICAKWLFFFAVAYGNDVSIERVNKEPVISQPGKVITVVLKLTNGTKSDMELFPGYGLPENWQPVSRLEPFLLKSLASELKLFSFQVPSNEIPGSYLLKFQLLKKGETEPIAKFSFPVDVLETYQLSIDPLDAPSFVSAGNEITASFIVRNLGNLPQHIAVKPFNCKVTGETTIYLKPKESNVVTVSAQTYPDILREAQHTLRLDAFLVGKPEIKSGAAQYIRVIPRSDLAIADDGLKLPVSLQLSYLGRTLPNGDFSTGFQGEIYANGQLDDEGEKQLELKLRGPNRFNAAVAAQYDEYFASYKSRNFNIFIGDKTYYLSQLTEFSRYGRGVEASFKLNNLELGAFYQAPLFYPGIKKEFATYARLHFSEDNLLSFNYLKKEFTDAGKVSDVLSVVGNFKILKSTFLETEYSRGNLNGEYGSGLRFYLISNPIDKLNLNLQYLSADKNFPGYYNNTKNISANVSFRISNKWSLSYLLNQDRSNVAEDTLFATAPFLNRKQAMIGFYPFLKTQIQLSGHQLQVEDRILPAKFNYKEDFLKFQWIQTFDNFRISAETELGNRMDYLKTIEDREIRTLRGNLNTWHQFSNRHSFGAFAQFYSFQHASSSDRQQWIFGMSANAVFKTGTKINLTVQNNFAQEEYYRNRNLWNLSIQQPLPKDQLISLSSYYTLLKGSDNNTDMSFVATYSWRFGIRMNNGNATQGVSGQVLPQGLQSVKGVVLQLNGQSVSTDEQGSFLFKNVPPGKYFLLIDPASVGLHIVPSIPTPISVEVQEGKTPHLVFGLIPSVTISGSIETSTMQSNLKGLKNWERFGSMIIEASNGTEVYRALTDENHWFEFPGLRPGNWTVKVLKKELYEGYQFLQDHFELELLPGQRSNIVFKVVKKMREIKFQENFPLQHIGN